MGHFLKTAQEHDKRDPIVAYWCRLYGLQYGLKLSTQRADEMSLFIGILGWLETFQRQHHDNEAVTNEVVAKAYMENYASKLFTHADQQDRAGIFNENVVKAYYTASVIYDVLLAFGELSKQAADEQKYAKFKATYIHTCLKNGTRPIPGLPNDGTNIRSDDGNVAGPSNAGSYKVSTPPPKPSTTDRDPSPDNPIEFESHSTKINTDKLPLPPIDPEIENPGGFQPYNPTSTAIISQYKPPSTNVPLTPAQLIKAQMYCKYAEYALNFAEVKTAIDNLEKALHLLTTGKNK